jgi:hypothetical protein
LAVIIKGKSVAGAKRLAVHLSRADTNERVEILEFRHIAADNLRDALVEMEALAAGTRCEKPLYHASINTTIKERLTEEQRAHSIEVLEKKLGLAGQPSIDVLHVKNGREHTHIVWSRIDLERMVTISDSHNYRKHEEVSRDLEREFGHERVQGAHVEREGKPRPERTPSHAEMQQAERTGLSIRQVREQVTELWHRTDSGKAFSSVLLQAGYVLARGDRRDFVVIDPKVGTHSLARCVEGARVKDLRARMAGIELSALPSVGEAKSIQRERLAQRGAGISPNARPNGSRQMERNTPEADRGRSHGTAEKPSAEAHVVGGVGRSVGAVLDGIASIFERGLSGAAAQSDPEPAGAKPEPRGPDVEPTVLADEEQKTKRRQELAREFGRELQDEREAESERERRRSR